MLQLGKKKTFRAVLGSQHNGGTEISHTPSAPIHVAPPSLLTSPIRMAYLLDLVNLY